MTDKHLVIEGCLLIFSGVILLTVLYYFYFFRRYRKAERRLEVLTRMIEDVEIVEGESEDAVC